MSTSACLSCFFACPSWTFSWTLSLALSCFGDRSDLPLMTLASLTILFLLLIKLDRNLIKAECIAARHRLAFLLSLLCALRSCVRMTDLRRCQCRLAEFGEIESAQVFIYLRARQVGLRLSQKSPAVCALSSSEKVHSRVRTSVRVSELRPRWWSFFASKKVV